MNVSVAAVLLLAALPLAAAEWYEDYESGKGNCDAGNYGTCIAKMNAAIAKKPKSEKSARTYGMNFVDYTPHYYLGLAYFNQGDIPRAVDAFDRESNQAVIFRTANEGSFSVMNKQANQALAATTPSFAPVAGSPSPSPIYAAAAAEPVADPGERARLLARIAELERKQAEANRRLAALQARLDAQPAPVSRASGAPGAWLPGTSIACMLLGIVLCLLLILQRLPRPAPAPREYSGPRPRELFGRTLTGRLGALFMMDRRGRKSPDAS